MLKWLTLEPGKDKGMSREKELNEIADGGYLRVAEVARLLHFSSSKVYKLLKNGGLKGRRLGGSWRVSKNALKAFLDK